MGILCCSNEVEDIPDTDHPRKADRCTDLSFLFVFCLFWIGLIFVAVYAFMVGSPSRFIHGSDSFGNVCGHYNERIDNLHFSGLDQTQRPYLFHLNQHDPKRSVKICVRKCPRQNLGNMAEIYQFYTRTNSSLCRYDFDFTNSGSFGASPSSLPYTTSQDRTMTNVSTQNEAGPCPVLPVYPTRSLLYHCVPEIAVLQGFAMGHSIYDFISSYVPLKKVVSDVCNAYEEMFIMAIVAIVASFVSAFVIHFIAHLASWFILVSISVLLVALTSIFWWAYIDAQYNLETFKFKKKLSFILPEDTENDSILLTISILCTIVTLVILYAASTLRSHVRFVVALFHETASCIRAMPFLLIQPLWTLFALMVFMCAWLVTMMALATADYESRESRYLQPQQQSAVDSVVSKATQLSSFTLINYRNSSWIQYMWWYLVIAFIWISEFILSCQQIVIAGAVTNWYFCRDRNNLQSPITRSIVDLISHHMGSVALGSFLITIFKLPRLIIQQLTSRLRQYEEYRIARKALQACSCCLWVVERFLNYLSRNAYSVVVIENADFCVSARMAFRALMSNAIKVAAINSIGDFILFLGKLSVAVLTAVVGMILVRSNPSLHYWTVPVILMSIFAFWIAHCLLSVYEMVIDAMFLCFCRDMNRHDGSPGNEYFAPQSLINFLSEDEEQLAEIRANQAQAAEAKEDDYATVN